MPLTQHIKNDPGEEIAGVILAAGDSERLGAPKQLFKFNGKTFIECAVDAAIEAGLKPVVVVLGYKSSKIMQALRKYNKSIRIIINKDWKLGQSTSMRVAIYSLISSPAIIFSLTDQPQISSNLIKLIKNKFIQENSDIVAPFAAGKRGNPVLFSRATYEDLLAVQGDQGGRSLFSKYMVERVEWSDERILIDVDTMEDYRRLMDAYGLK